MAKRLDSKKKSFNFVSDLAKDIEDVSAEMGLSETALAVLSIRTYIAQYKAAKEKVTKESKMSKR